MNTAFQFAGEKAIKGLWEDSDIGVLGRFIGTAGVGWLN